MNYVFYFQQCQGLGGERQLGAVSEEILKIALEHVAQGERRSGPLLSPLGLCHVTLACYVKVRRRVHGEGGSGGSGDSPTVGYRTGKKVFTDDQEVKLAEFLKAAAAVWTVTASGKRMHEITGGGGQELSFDAVHRYILRY